MLRRFESCPLHVKHLSPVELFCLSALTESQGALDSFRRLPEADRMDVLMGLHFHTMRALFDGKPPGFWRRTFVLWRLYGEFGPRYRDEIAVLVDCPFNPDRAREMPAGAQIPQLVIAIAGYIPRRLGWSTADMQAHVEQIKKSLARP